MLLDPLPKKTAPNVDQTPAQLFVAGQLISAGTLTEMIELFEVEVTSHRAPLQLKVGERVVRRRD